MYIYIRIIDYNYFVNMQTIKKFENKIILLLEEIFILRFEEINIMQLIENTIKLHEKIIHL